MGLCDWVRKLTSAFRPKPAPVLTPAGPPSTTTISEMHAQCVPDSFAVTRGNIQDPGTPELLSDDGVITGWRFSATLQMRTPLRVLRWHNKVVLDRRSALPKVIEEPWEGVWSPQIKSWRELGVPVDEFERVMASEVGCIPEDGGDYLGFLIAVREVVETQEPIHDRLHRLRALLADSKWPEDIMDRVPVERVVDSLFPRFVDTIDGINGRIARELRKLGLDTPARLASASDQSLLAIKGIGSARLLKIRERCEHIKSNRDLDRVDAVTR